jgi:hypothetical protein
VSKLFCTLWSLTLLASVLGGCDILTNASPPRVGKWEALPGMNGAALWAFGFDSTSHPLAAGYGGLRRYSDADGWLEVGKASKSVLQAHLFPANDGGTYIVDTGTSVHKLAPGASQWTSVRDKLPDSAYSAPSVQFVGGDGTFYGQVTNVGIVKLGPTDTSWQLYPAGIPGLTDTANNAYFFPQMQSIMRLDAGQTTPKTLADCHSKVMLQCTTTLQPLRVSDHNSLYVINAGAGTIGLYEVALAGGTPTLVAEMPPDLGYYYFKSAWVTSDGTAYLTASRGSDAYGYGDVWRFKAGDTKGSMIFRAGANFGADVDNKLPVAPDADIAVAPDGTIYSYLPVKGGVSRYKP